MENFVSAPVYYISSYSSVRNYRVSGNFNFKIKKKYADFNQFARHIYELLNLDYPKYFKMDNLSKLAFLCSEMLLKNMGIEKLECDQVGIVLCNSLATLDTDQNYFQTIENKTNYFPSPSLFVYTLPNIMIGEICIRNKIKGENAFFVFKEFNHKFINNYVSNLLNTGKIKSCITGWVDFQQHHFEACLFLVESENRSHDSLQYTVENTIKLYSA